MSVINLQSNTPFISDVFICAVRFLKINHCAAFLSLFEKIIFYPTFSG